MSNAKSIEFGKSFLEKGWTSEKVGKNAEIFSKPVSESVIQNMPDIHITQHSGIGNVIDWLGSTLKSIVR